MRVFTFDRGSAVDRGLVSGERDLDRVELSNFIDGRFTPAMRLLVRLGCFLGCLPAAVPVLAQPAPVERRAATLATTPLTAKTTRIAPDKTKLSIASKMAGADFKLFDATGKEVASTVLRDGTLEAVVDPKRAYILSRPAPTRQVLRAEGLQFPARYVTFSNTGTVNLGGLFLRPARVPLTWDDRTGAYVTELLIGYEFQDGSERPLAAPKTVAFFAEGSNARIQADIVEIKSSGVSGYQRVKLSTTEAGGETLFTARASPVDEVKSSVAIRREPGRLKLTLPSTEIAAFGVGSGTLTVSLLAQDGFPLSVEQPLEVQLSSHRLRLPASIVLPRGQSSAEIDFRSAGYGADGIIAQSGRLTTSQLIHLIFPVAATVAAVGGGALGGIARYLRNWRRPRRQRPLLARRLLEGVLVGVIFVGAAWAGLVVVSLRTGILGTPFGAFVLAALSGYVGCIVLDRVTGRTFQSLKSKA